MEAFRNLTAIAAPLARANVDTEVIIPIRRLIAFPRGQLGPWCFEPWRYGPDGELSPDFALNDPRYGGARILVAGENFGTGSSREAAVWALWDMGIRVVIAPSFGDIFRANCFQNGLLPITLSAPSVDALLEAITRLDHPVMTVDLVQGRITGPEEQSLSFTIDAERRIALIAGLDEIGMTLQRLPVIQAFQHRDREARPWAYQMLETS